jgi:protein-disulfide isomerase
MLLTRRVLLSAAVAGTALSAVARAQNANAAIDPEGERAVGKPDARVKVEEWFSLTCTHCAAFSRLTMPEVKTKLIDTGQVRYIFRDFPLDQVALTAAMVARYLPPDRYEPFITALFASQDRWAFARGVSPTEELSKLAALAGMSHERFQIAINDDKLRSFILQQQDEAQKKWHVDSTPTFIVNGQVHAGEMSFKDFNQLVQAAAPA